MMTEEDIEWMRNSQDEIYVNRTHEIIVIYLDKVYDDYTGQYVGEESISRTVDSVITEMSGAGERFIVGGIEYDTADAKFDVKRSELVGIADKITQISYGDEEYEILGDDRKGIGRRNRMEIVGKVIT